jgi:hypothetical protein
MADIAGALGQLDQSERDNEDLICIFRQCVARFTERVLTNFAKKLWAIAAHLFAIIRNEQAPLIVRAVTAGD